METIIRAIFIYLFLIAAFRIAGRRTLSDATTTDLVLLLIISETIQQALVQGDSSLTTAALLVITLITLEMIFLALKIRFPLIDHIVEGVPVKIIEKGEIKKPLLNILNVDVDDILEAARRNNEIESLDKIKDALVEKNGDITVIPK